jgi:hypothetical protein
VGVLERFRANGLNGRAFCAREDLGYASFCAWRQKLAGDLSVPATTSTSLAPPETAFIDLGPMAAPAGKTWAVELELGGGVVLRLRRG